MHVVVRARDGARGAQGGGAQGGSERGGGERGGGERGCGEHLELQDDLLQREPLDLRDAVGAEQPLRAVLRVQQEGLAGADAAGAPDPLARVLGGDPDLLQRRHALALLVRRLLDAARVDDVLDIVDGDGRLGNVGREHDLAHAGRRVPEDEGLLARKRPNRAAGLGPGLGFGLELGVE